MTANVKILRTRPQTVLAIRVMDINMGDLPEWLNPFVAQEAINRRYDMAGFGADAFLLSNGELVSRDMLDSKYEPAIGASLNG